jgi:hypothetical protein
MRGEFVFITGIVLAVFLSALSCGCMNLTDEATGVWENEQFSTQERMTIKPDGTFFISDLDGNEMNNGTWRKIEDDYEFIFENDREKVYAEMSRGRAQLFMTFDNATYTKI